MKEQRLLSESPILDDYLAQAQKLRSQELARLSGLFVRLPGALIRRVFRRLPEGVQSSA